jgi:hypothetical protein
MNDVFARTLADKVRRGQPLAAAVADAVRECQAPEPTIRELAAIQAKYPECFQVTPTYKRLIR